MRHLRYFLFFSGMLFLLTGCRPDYEQALDNMQATQRLVSAVVHPNYMQFRRRRQRAQI